MSIKGIGCDSAEWINLAQDSDGWWSLWTRSGTSGFHKRRKISWPAERLSAS
jgi:hypothetical protein